MLELHTSRTVRSYGNLMISAISSGGKAHAGGETREI